MENSRKTNADTVLPHFPGGRPQNLCEEQRAADTRTGTAAADKFFRGMTPGTEALEPVYPRASLSSTGASLQRGARLLSPRFFLLQHAAQQLSCRCTREFVYDHDFPRQFVGRNLALAEGDQLFGAESLPRLQHHECF